jgi:enamine deaminase RidA (YjgF/YER057c/UK114 family)
MITRHNPTQLHNPPGYRHVTVVESGRLAFLSGQCPLDAFGALVGAGDIDLQIDQVAANAAAVLAAVGARPDQVVRSVVYVVSDDNSVLAAAWRQLSLSVIGSAFTTASTLLGVTRLGFSGPSSSKSTSPPHFDHTPAGAKLCFPSEHRGLYVRRRRTRRPPGGPRLRQHTDEEFQFRASTK